MDGSVLEWAHRIESRFRPSQLVDASTIKSIVQAAKGGESQEQGKLANALMKVVETLQSSIECEQKKLVKDTEDKLEEEGKVL